MYKKIKKILTTRDAILVRYKQGDYEVFSKTFTEIERSGKEKTKELAKEFAFYDTLVPDYLADAELEIIEAFDIPKAIFKVGDEVVSTGKYRKGEICKIEEIQRIGKAYFVSFDDGNDALWLDQSELSYPFTKPKEEKKAKVLKIEKGQEYTVYDENGNKVILSLKI